MKNCRVSISGCHRSDREQCGKLMLYNSQIYSPRGDFTKSFSISRRRLERERARRERVCRLRKKSSMQSTDEPSTQARIPRKSIASELVIDIPRPDTVRVLFIAASGHSFRLYCDLTLLGLICNANSHSNRISEFMRSLCRKFSGRK